MTENWIDLLAPKIYAYIFCFNQPFFRSIQNDLSKSLNTTTRDDTRLEEVHAERPKNESWKKVTKLLFLMVRIIAIVLVSYFLVTHHHELQLQFQFSLLSHKIIVTIISMGLIMGAMNQMFTYCLDMKKLKWMILCLMLSVFECILVAVLSSFFHKNSITIDSNGKQWSALQIMENQILVC